MNTQTLKNTSTVLPLLAGIAGAILGLLLLFNAPVGWHYITILISVLFILFGLSRLFAVFAGTSSKRMLGLVFAALCILGGAALLSAPYVVVGAIDLITALLALLTGILVLVDAFMRKKNDAPWLQRLFTGLIYTGFGITLFFYHHGERVFTVILGLYVFFFSLNIIGDAIAASFKHNSDAQKVKHRMRISLPSFVAALLPIKALRSVNELLEDEPAKALLLSEEDSNAAPDLEVYIHTKEGLIPGMGHVDIALGDDVFTYGNYDQASWKLGGFIADGVMVTMNREAHIKTALDYEKKLLIVFGLKLTPEQKKAVEDQLKTLSKDFIAWKSESQRAEAGELPGPPEAYKDIASLTWQETGGNFYKFKQGNPFKTYYAVGTNCVKLADTVVGHSGIDLLDINGIITPGAYLDYLNRLYERGDSIVISRRFYKNDFEGETLPEAI